MVDLRKKLFRETTFLLLQPEEYNPAEDSEANFIRMFTKAENSSIVLAQNSESHLLDFLGVAGGTTNSTKHKATVFLGLREYWGNHSGGLLFEALFSGLQQNKVIRLELTTAINNERAYSLYTKVGFKVEGIKKANIAVDGKLVDKYMMSYVIE